MTRTLITGVAGFTGRYLAALLTARGHEVHGLVHRPPGGPAIDAAGLHQGDVADSADVDRILAAVQPERVVHLAAVAFVAHRDVAEMYRSNILGTRQLLDGLAHLPSRPQAVILASSANIYGNRREGVLDEALRPAPANDYGITKVAVEQLAALYGGRLPLTVVRPFNSIGRGQSTEFVIAKIVDHVRRRAPVIALGNLDVARDFSDVRGVVDAYARLLATPATVGGTFNICSGRASSLGEVLDLVSSLSGHKLEVRVDPALVRDDEVRSLRGTAQRLEEAIGPLTMPPLEETLRWMLDE